MFRRFVCALVIASSLAVSLRAQSAAPQSITPEGGMPIPRAGEAMRVHLLGLIDL